jgi:Mg-chelatase subunit ChlD
MAEYEPSPAVAHAAEVIVVDHSGSMSSPQTKISAARQATAAAIDMLRDGVLFGVVAGNHVAQMVYPPDARLVPTSATTRAEAKAAVASLRPEGGTAIGQWLMLADRLR